MKNQGYLYRKQCIAAGCEQLRCRIFSFSVAMIARRLVLCNSFNNTFLMDFIAILLSVKVNELYNM